MKPMTKEEWDARQSVIRKVVDPETGRTRWGALVKPGPRPALSEGAAAAALKGQGWGEEGSPGDETSQAVPPHCLEQAAAGTGRALRVLREPLFADLMAEPTRPPFSLSQGWLCPVALALGAQPVPPLPQAH